MRTELQGSGITSTYVENTVKYELGIENGRDHLHIRGEYSVSFGPIFGKAGSPPHTWRIQ